MDPMVTIHVTDAGVRISKITVHGEEIVVPDMEIQAAATRLWGQIYAGSLTGYEDFGARLEGVGRELQAGRDALERPLAALDAILAELRELRTRLSAVEERLKEKVITREDLNAWLRDGLTQVVKDHLHKNSSDVGGTLRGAQ
jgi:exonuclease VII small subunit